MVKVFFYKAIDVLRPLTNDPFCPISSSDSNYNPRNTYCITVVKIFVFLDLAQNWSFLKGLKSRSNLREKRESDESIELLKLSVFKS